MSRTNEHGQPIGEPVAGWSPRPLPPATALTGRYCRVEPLAPTEHGHDLYEAFAAETTGALWTYMSQGPFTDFASFETWLDQIAGESDPMFHTILADGTASGLAAYLRIAPAMGVIEVGNISFAPRLQRTRAATESMYLMMRRAFDELGYRRYEWKADALNAPSGRAALRLGFTYEGMFKQAVVYKGRNRDTAWYAITDAEWPRVRDALEAWLDPANFDADGHQLQSLEDARGR
ncbi:MAG: GNAT family N-acetyltransferase [Gaiellaceae bacterium]